MPNNYRVPAPQPGFFIIVNPGDKFGRLTVVREAEGIQRYAKDGTKNGFRRQFECKCKCGEIRIIQLDSLRSGCTQSCRCFGDNANFKHGLTHMPEFSIWRHMVNRCGAKPGAKPLPIYVERGIFAEWVESFEAFFKHIGPRPSDKHSVDRIDNAKGYFPGNVRWATSTEQNRNKCNNVMVEFYGTMIKLVSLSDLHPEIGLPILRDRFRRGLSDAALIAPKYTKQRRPG